MTIDLNPFHEKWLAEQVAAGRFPSIDEAVARLIDDAMDFPGDDLEWARPYIEAGDASLARGEGIPGDQFLDWLKRKRDSLR